eukprot:757175-Hanusia_phi.AAC.8
MSSSSFQNVARTVGGELAKQGILMAKEVPGSVAAAIGIAGFVSWSYLAMRGDNPAMKRQNRLSWLAKKSITGRKARTEETANSEGYESDDGFEVVAREGRSHRDESSSEDGEMEDVQYLVEEEVAQRNVDEVFSAVMKRDISTIKRAVDKGVVDSSTCDAYGNTLLILAAQSGSAEIVSFLIDQGFSVNAQNWRGQTALHFAYAFSYHQLCDLLLSNGARYHRTTRHDFL